MRAVTQVNRGFVGRYGATQPTSREVTPMADDPKQPTPEELAQAQQVSAAAAGAMAEAQAKGEGAEGARTRANTAVESKAKEVGFKLSEEDRHALVDELIERLNELGAFEPAPPAPAPAPEAAAEAAAEVAAAQPPPEKRTFAQKFAGEI